MSKNIIGVRELLGKLDSLQKMKAAKAGIKAAALYLKGIVAKYPKSQRLTRESVYGRPFQTDRQRRFFFAALRDGRIEVPYQRGESPGSQRFKESWTIATENQGLTAIIGNNTTYGKYLKDAELQSKYAKAVGWTTVSDDVAQATERVLEIVKYAVDRDLAD